jgi:excisionase family DNA binding protein
MTDPVKNDSTGRTGPSPSTAPRSRASDARAEPELAPPLSYRINDVCRLTGLGRTTIYAAIRDGHLVAKKDGRCTIVLHEDLVAFLRNLPNAR